MSDARLQETERHLWVRADAVKPGDRVLCKVEALEVTHSQVTDAGYWMLRFPRGALYINAAAPVALVDGPADQLRKEGTCPRCGGAVVNPARHGEGWCIDAREEGT